MVRRTEVTRERKKSSRVCKEGKDFRFKTKSNLTEQSSATLKSHLVAFRSEVPSSFGVQEVNQEGQL